MNLSKYTDVYFLRSLKILQYFNLNPFVRAQIFIRQGTGKVGGINEVLQVISLGSNLIRNGGRVFSLPQNGFYTPDETIIVIEGKAQDVIPLETVILGIISSRTTQLNDQKDIDLDLITERVKKIKKLIGERLLFYFGARHWHYLEDKKISQAVFAGGASEASTDEGASVVGRKGIGTIPHSLENIFAWKFGIENAVTKTTVAFDRVIDTSVSRIALVDYANKEISDSLKVARILGNKLYGIRIDTCGENIMQGAENGERKYWQGRGVTVSGVYAVRLALDNENFHKIKIFLSSGFGDIEKVQEFVTAEKILNKKLFDVIGVGNLFRSRIATMDLVGVGQGIDTIQPFAKEGRFYRPNPRLFQVL